MAEEKIKKDFEFLKDKVLALLIYGSYIRDKQSRDIDICIVAPEKKPKEILKEVYRKVDVYGKKYDVYIFEELPLYMKVEIMQNHKVVFGDIYELYEYFYFVNKLWEDQKHRQEMSEKEIEAFLQ